MIWALFSQHKARILLTYAIFMVEFVLFAFLPFFLGKGIDALLAGKPLHFWIFVCLAVAGEAIGYLRRRFDTRVFMSIWTKSVSKTIGGMIDRGLKSELIINRSYLVQHYVNFFEYTMPSGVSSIVNILISCWMIVMAAHSASVVLVMVLIAMAICYILSHKIQAAELAIQDSREAVGESIGAADKDKVSENYDLMGRRFIHRSDLDALAWTSASSLSLLSQVVVVLLVVNAGHTLGTIMACIAYTTRIFERVDILGMLLNQWKQVGIADKLLATDETNLIETDSVSLNPDTDTPLRDV